MLEKVNPKKKLGQNFLINKFTINKISEIINISADDLILEVGPGQGALTENIIKKTKNYIGIEKDSNLCKILKSNYGDKITLRNEDILETNFKNIYKRKYRIIGNIPYNISTKLLLKCIENKEDITNIHFMMQKEFVDRIVSEHGNKSYGRLTVLIQLFFIVEKYIDIDPKDFYPPPKIHSSFMSLTPRKKILLAKDEIEDFLVFSKSIFSTRRKKIKNCINIRSINLYDNMDKRAEELTIIEMIKLFRDIRNDGEFV